MTQSLSKILFLSLLSAFILCNLSTADEDNLTSKEIKAIKKEAKQRNRNYPDMHFRITLADVFYPFTNSEDEKNILKTLLKTAKVEIEYSPSIAVKNVTYRTKTTRTRDSLIGIGGLGLTYTKHVYKEPINYIFTQKAKVNLANQSLEFIAPLQWNQYYPINSINFIFDRGFINELPNLNQQLKLNNIQPYVNHVTEANIYSYFNDLDQPSSTHNANIYMPFQMDGRSSESLPHILVRYAVEAFPDENTLKTAPKINPYTQVEKDRFLKGFLRQDKNDYPFSLYSSPIPKQFVNQYNIITPPNIKRLAGAENLSQNFIQGNNYQILNLYGDLPAEPYKVRAIEDWKLLDDKIYSILIQTDPHQMNLSRYERAIPFKYGVTFNDDGSREWLFEASLNYYDTGSFSEKSTDNDFTILDDYEDTLRYLNDLDESDYKYIPDSIAIFQLKRLQHARAMFSKNQQQLMDEYHELYLKQPAK